MTMDNPSKALGCCGDPDEAVEALTKIDLRLSITRHKKERASLLLNRAVFCGILDRFDDARNDLHKAVLETPEDPDTRLQSDYIGAVLYDEEDNPGEALAAFSTLLSRYASRLAEPECKFIYQDIQLRRAFELSKLSKFREAISIFQACLAFDLTPQLRSGALANLGICYSQIKDRDAAKRYLVQASQSGLSEEWAPEVHFHLGLTYANLERLEDSKREFLICEQLCPDPVVYAWLARICELLGQDSEAVQYARLAKPC